MICSGSYRTHFLKGWATGVGPSLDIYAGDVHENILREITFPAIPPQETDYSNGRYKSTFFGSFNNFGGFSASANTRYQDLNSVVDGMLFPADKTKIPGKKALVSFSNLIISLSVQSKSDSGAGVANASDVNGTFIPFNTSFVAVDFVNIVVRPGSAGMISEVDWGSGSYPTGFYIKTFDFAGNRANMIFNWNAGGK